MADDAAQSAADSSAYQHEEPLPSAPPRLSQYLIKDDAREARPARQFSR